MDCFLFYVYPSDVIFFNFFFTIIFGCNVVLWKLHWEV